MLSLDTEQIWAYQDPLFDPLDEPRFQNRYPGAIEAHDKLLNCLQTAGVGATWLVVGGLALRESAGPRDSRMAGLPAHWTVKIPSGGETTAPLWYRRSFVERLREHPLQEVGLHGGLTHFAWKNCEKSKDVIRWELTEGLKALEQISLRARSFSFARDEEAHHDLLADHGIQVYRGRTPALAYRLGRTLPGVAMRALDELRRATPPPVWPSELLPGLWNIPSSQFLYPIGPSRTRVVALKTRAQRFSRGLEAAARYRGIFHFSFHPENLAESPDGFSLLEDLLEKLIRVRERGDVEILTMGEAAARMSALDRPSGTHPKGTQTYASH